MEKEKKIILTNAFSLSMLSEEWNLVSVVEITDSEAREIVRDAEVESAIGHESTARVVSEILGITVKAERKMVKLKDSNLLVFQLMERLPEGRVLNEEELRAVKHKWFLVMRWGHGTKENAKDYARALFECL